MGYTTEFEGHVTIDPPLNETEVAYLKDFGRMRHMNRTNGPLWISPTVSVDYGQSRDSDIIDFNQPPPGVPGLWCQWEPSDDGTSIAWDGGEKFYYSAEWMKWIIDNLLSPKALAFVHTHVDENSRLPAFTCDHVVNGRIEAQGEEADDTWVLIVEDNVVKVSQGTVTYGEPRPL